MRAILFGAAALLVTSCGSSENERGKDAALSAFARTCISLDTQDGLKDRLFDKVAQAGGPSATHLAELKRGTFVRIEDAVISERDDKLAKTTCSGRLAINLPPASKLSASGVLFAEVRYSIQRSAKGDGDVYDVSGAEQIISLLASNKAPELSDAAKADAKRYGPGFTCGPSNNDVETLICESAELSRLDRYLNQLYDEALIFSNAPGYKSELRRFQNQFLEDRNACRNDECIADAYRAQMENLQVLMEIPARLDPEIAPDA